MSTSSGRSQFSKRWMSIDEQLSRLADRGLEIPDRPAAKNFLSHLNYYRFSGYCIAFEDARHSFRANTSFADVQAAYTFDVALRDLLTEALEVIEVDTRSAIAHLFGKDGGAFAHCDPNHFRPSFKHPEWIVDLEREVGRSKERFVKHYKDTYDGFPSLPCWMSTEVMSFGTLSKMYKGLRDRYQAPIASRYSMQKLDLESALHHLSYIRNLCAHHSRLWDREFSITLSLPQGQNWRHPLVPDPTRLFPTLILTYRLLIRCPFCDTFAKEWRRRVNSLMKQPPATANALTLMGMPPNWYNHPYWV